MATKRVEVLGGGKVQLPNGDVWNGHKREAKVRPDTLEAPTEQERATNAELTEAALAAQVFVKVDEKKTK